MEESCKMKKPLSILLLCAMLTAAFASCASDTGAPSDDTTAQAASEDTTASETTAAETADPNDRSSAVSTLDESLDFGGATINIGYTGHVRYRTDVMGEDDGDIINTAIFERNINVEEDLNIKFNMIELAEKTTDATNAMRTVVLAGDDVYDICSTHQSYTSKMLFEGLFANLADDEYISYDSPWWAYDYMKEFTIGDDRMYFLFGDISLMMLKSAGAVYFNKPLFDKYVGPVDEIYSDVLDGKWTMDMLYEYSSKSYSDLNGNGTVDAGDLYGVMATSVKNVEHFQYDAGIRTTARNSDDIPEIILNNERTISFAEKLYNLYYNNPAAKIFTADTSLDGEILPIFKNNELVFFPSWFYTAEMLRDMENDFGIIPYPKLDEMQEEYMTLVHNGSTTFYVPISISDEKFKYIGAVLEDMAYHSYKLVTPAYFEVAMKAKYSRDDISSQLLDIMYESMYTDFGYCYSSNLNGIGLLRDLAKQKTADFTSWYASKEEGAIDSLEELVNLYLYG